MDDLLVGGKSASIVWQDTVHLRLKISESASSIWENLKEKPRSVARRGNARWPLSRSASAISPSIRRRANPGAGRKLGRRRARPSAFEKSALVTGAGAVALKGPRAESVSMVHLTIRTQSSR